MKKILITVTRKIEKENSVSTPIYYGIEDIKIATIINISTKFEN